MRKSLLCALVLGLLASSAAAQERSLSLPLPRARPNRMLLGLGFGVGTASMDGSPAKDVAAALASSNPGITVGTPESAAQINAGIWLRYYLPYHLLAETGYDTLYNTAESTFSTGAFEGKVTSDSLVMEVPFLIGGYLTVADRLYLRGAVGPSMFFFARSYWDAEPGAISDFKADNGVGFHALAGATYLLADSFGLDLEARWRQLETGSLREMESGVVVKSGALRGDGSAETYRLDFSGASIALNLCVFFM